MFTGFFRLASLYNFEKGSVQSETSDMYGRFYPSKALVSKQAYFLPVTRKKKMLLRMGKSF
jgi:hypothetical protein